MSERKPKLRLRSPFSRELGGLASDAGYLAIWQASTTVSQFVQIALITHILGLHDYGRLALVVSATILISQFFDVNVGVATTTFGMRKLASDPLAARAVFQLSYLTDAVTGVVAFLVVVGLAPVIGPTLVGQHGQQLLVLYALVALSSTLDQSSVSILRLLGKFRLFALSASMLELMRVVIVTAALVAKPTLVTVVIALLIAGALSGFTQVWLAAGAFRREVGQSSLFAKSCKLAPDDRRAFLRTIWHTNVISYVRLAQVQLPTLIVGALAGATQVGAYKIGTAAASIPAKLLDPAQAAVLPRISRLWSANRFAEIRLLLRQVSYVSVGVTLVGFALLAGPLGGPVLRVLGGASAVNAGRGVLVVSALALSTTAALFWNSSVLFAADRARTLAKFYVLTGIAQCFLLVPFVYYFGAVGAACALLVSTLLGNLLTTVSALRCVRAADRMQRDASHHRSPDGVILSRS